MGWLCGGCDGGIKIRMRGVWEDLYRNSSFLPWLCSKLGCWDIVHYAASLLLRTRVRRLSALDSSIRIRTRSRARRARNLWTSIACMSRASTNESSIGGICCWIWRIRIRRSAQPYMRFRVRVIDSQSFSVFFGLFFWLHTSPPYCQGLQ